MRLKIETEILNFLTDLLKNNFIKWMKLFQIGMIKLLPSTILKPKIMIQWIGRNYRSTNVIQSWPLPYNKLMCDNTVIRTLLNSDDRHASFLLLLLSLNKASKLTGNETHVRFPNEESHRRDTDNLLYILGVIWWATYVGCKKFISVLSFFYEKACTGLNKTSSQEVYKLW